MGGSSRRLKGCGGWRNRSGRRIRSLTCRNPFVSGPPPLPIIAEAWLRATRTFCHLTSSVEISTLRADPRPLSPERRNCFAFPTKNARPARRRANCNSYLTPADPLAKSLLQLVTGGQTNTSPVGMQSVKQAGQRSVSPTDHSWFVGFAGEVVSGPPGLTRPLSDQSQTTPNRAHCRPVCLYIASAAQPARNQGRGRGGRDPIVLLDANPGSDRLVERNEHHVWHLQYRSWTWALGAPTPGARPLLGTKA